MRPGAVLHVAPAVLSVFLVLYLGSMPQQPQLLPTFTFRDKVGHFFAFGFVAFTHFRAIRFLAAEASHGFAVWMGALSSSLVGGVLELWQMALSYRSAEWGDLAADVLGASCMAGLLAWTGRSKAV